MFRWVLLPAAGVEVVLKGYKKREARIAKLKSLPEPWTSYIPPGHGRDMDIVDNTPNAAVELFVISASHILPFDSF